MAQISARLLRDGFQYLESARWHDGSLWFSDIPAGQVWRLWPQDGTAEVVAEVRGPSGLGFMPDGTPMVVSQELNKLLRIADGKTEEVARLDGVAVKANDMWIDPQGRAYLTQIGWDYYRGEEPTGSSVVIVDPDGSVRTAGEGLMCPNGIGLTPDGSTLYVAETFGGRLTAFDVTPDGQLSGQRVHAQFAAPTEGLVDGLCIDREGAVWLTFPFRGEVARVTRAGDVQARVTGSPGNQPFIVACALGGEELRTLYMCEMTITPQQIEDHFAGSAGRIVAADVDVPGFTD
jgi:sugar lactone lactonase YvrE